MVVGDLGLGPGDHAQEGGLAHVGKAHQPHVGQQFQLQQHLPALAGQAGLGKAGGLAGGGGEVLVAPAAVAALGQDEVGLGGQVADDLPGGQIPHHRALWHPDDQVGPILARAALAPAVLAVLRGVLALVAKVQQGGHMGIHPQHHVAASAAVAAVRAAGGHILLPVEGDGTASAVARFHHNAGRVDKLIGHGPPPSQAPAGAGAAEKKGALQGGSTPLSY